MNINYIGIDIAKDTFAVAIPQPKGGYQDHNLTNNEQGFTELVALLPQNSQCIMEASGPYYLPLATYLDQHQFSLSVINPLVIRRFSQMQLRRAKTDKADARLLSAFGANQIPQLWQPPATLMSQIAQLQTLLGQYVKQRTALQNQQESFQGSGVPNPGLVASLEKSLAHLGEQIKELETQLDNLAKTHHAELYANLQTIPGVGRKTALCLLVITSGFSRFDSAKQLASFAGIAPRVFVSGTSVKGRGHICKLGSGRIRQLLYMASMQAKKANAGCKALYDRLVAGGKPKLVALIAVSHKLLRQCFAVAKNGVVFNEKLSLPLVS